MDYSWILYILLAGVVSFMATAMSMPALLHMCRRRGIYDVPNERKVHSNNIPRLGGVLFIPCMLIGATAALFIMPERVRSALFDSLSYTTFTIVTGMFLIYLIGLLDDLFGLRASVKFTIQFAVSLFLPFCGLYVQNLYGLIGIYELPLWAGYGLTVFLSLLIVNAINLIDGIDGLASSLFMLAMACFGLLFMHQGMYFYTLYCFALVGTVAAFWLFNMFGRAEKSTKTFMGDTGSLTLGFALTFVAIRYIMVDNRPVTIGCNEMMPIVAPFSLLAVPCFDLVRVATMRIIHGKPMFHPDKTHIHHKCLHAGFSMHASLLMIFTLQVLVIAANWGIIRLGGGMSSIAVFDVLLFIAFILWLNWRIVRKGTLKN